MKHFLILGHINAITYKEIFPLIKENKLWLGITNPKIFITPDGTEQSFGNICWYTNLAHEKRNGKLTLYKKYSPEEFPHYDNYDAINVNKKSSIPMDWEGVMGVPITFLDKYNPEQFELLSCHEPCINLETLKTQPGFKEYKSRQILYEGKLCQKTYHRLFIRNKKTEK